MSPSVLILGCGFTGLRLARRLIARGIALTVTTRDPERLHELERAGVQILAIDAARREDLERLCGAVTDGARVVHSIPPLENGGVYSDETPALIEALGARPSRVVYLSTTGVYGAAREVDEHTAPAPRTARETLRVSAERAVAGGPWPSLVLRPAAIYGPGRGIHESMKRGEFRLRDDGSNWVSRIHVEDLAAHVEAALFSTVTGAFPVADEHPCPSREIAGFCARLLGVPMPGSVPAGALSETRRADRRVDGSAIRKRLGVVLRYPSYRTGIPASLE